jgi:hypothetical protein
MSDDNANRARRRWGANPPDWILALAQRCDQEKSQAKVGELLGVSSAVVNQLLGRSYEGRMDRMETRVRGALMKETVSCPVLGVISTRDCLDHQKRPFRATNLMRVKLHQACPTCPNREAACSKKS